MRLLRLVAPDTFAVEFHPYITVLTAVTDSQREAIVAAFEQAAAGRTSGLEGLIEVHGVVLDLDERSLSLLELGDDEVDICVRPSDLPGSISGSVGQQVRAAEARLEGLEQPHRDRVNALASAERVLEEATAERETAEIAVTEPPEEPEAEAPTTMSDGARVALLDRKRALDQERRGIEAGLDPGAAAAVHDATIARDLAQAASEQAVALAGATDPSSPEGTDDLPMGPLDPDERDEHLADLKAALSLHRLEDPTEVRDALDELRLTHSSGQMAPSTEALSLADRIESFGRRIDGPDGDAPSGTDLETAMDEVDRAKDVLAEAERRSSTRGGAEDLAALEEAHAAVEAARDATGGRIGRARAQRRLDDALAVQDELLKRLGLSSYTEYLTRGGSAAPIDGGAGAVGEVEIARRALERAESTASSVEEQVSSALAHAEGVAEWHALLDDARRLLDDPDLADDRVAAALIDHRVPASDAAHVQRLVDVLDSVGLPVRDLGLSVEEIETMAAEWLTERQHSEARLLRRIEDLEAAGPDDDEDDETSRSAASIGADEAIRHADDALVEAEEALRTAEARLRAHEEAEEALAACLEASSDVESELSALEDPADPDPVTDTDAAADAATERDVAAADAAVGSARESVAVAAAAVDASQVEYGAAVEELASLRQTLSELDEVPPAVDEIEWYLLARLAGQRQQSFVGSLPLVVVGALDGVRDDEGLVHLLDRLARMAGAVQIVHITDDPRVVGWVEGLDDGRGSVVRPVSARSD